MSTRHRSPLRRQLTLTLFEAMLIGVVLACLENWLLPLVQLRLAAGARCCCGCRSWGSPRCRRRWAT